MGTNRRRRWELIVKPSICARPTPELSTTSALPVSALLSLSFPHCGFTNAIVGLNIGAHKEAAEHFLSALAMQQSNSGETSDQLWFTLRRAFLSMVGVIAVGTKSGDHVLLYLETLLLSAHPYLRLRHALLQNFRLS